MTIIIGDWQSIMTGGWFINSTTIAPIVPGPVVPPVEGEPAVSYVTIEADRVIWYEIPAPYVMTTIGWGLFEWGMGPWGSPEVWEGDFRFVEWTSIEVG